MFFYTPLVLWSFNFLYSCMFYCIQGVFYNIACILLSLIIKGGESENQLLEREQQHIYPSVNQQKKKDFVFTWKFNFEDLVVKIQANKFFILRILIFFVVFFGGVKLKDSFIQYGACTIFFSLFVREQLTVKGTIKLQFNNTTNSLMKSLLFFPSNFSI
eukprot:TRINITY_DN849_c1_g1_i1.p8 TRINITY_DN849_c1_g1~~TRINITY_DN849_c1_g1_i1.p8  ORF type:complete len:159 (+),score=13.83 TRINITY_DN849_c1_g1_i1:586-1062(+)